jgi:anti-sigma factor (TIGR02949 family)
MTISTELEREPIDCRTAVQQLWDYLDHELDTVRMTEVTAHVERCAECGEHFAFARTFLTALSASRSDVPDAAALRSRVVDALQREGFTSDA